jgi:hypothetical protein
MIPTDLTQWTEWARRDDWGDFFSASDIRLMLGEIARLRREEIHLRGLVQAYSDMAKSQ